MGIKLRTITLYSKVTNPLLHPPFFHLISIGGEKGVQYNTASQSHETLCSTSSLIPPSPPRQILHGLFLGIFDIKVQGVLILEEDVGIWTKTSAQFKGLSARFSGIRKCTNHKRCTPLNWGLEVLMLDIHCLHKRPAYGSFSP